MGSFQQIVIGIVCLVAAFLFGSYVNSHPDPDLVTNAFSDIEDDASEGAVTSLLEPGMAAQRAAPMETMHNQLASRLPTLKSMSKSQLSVDLPPPSQLDQPAENGIQLSPTKMPNLLDSVGRREVVVPDFSRLASEFKNTPLELPPMHGSNEPIDDEMSSTGQSSQVNLFTGTLTPNSPVKTESLPSEPSVQQIPTEFQSDDFMPNLKSRLQQAEQANGIGSGLEEEDPDTFATGSGSILNQLPSESEQSAKILNPVRSYQDREPSPESPIVTNEPPPGTDYSDQVNRQGAVDSDSNSSISAAQTLHHSAKPKVPFGLNEQAKSQFVRLKRPSDSRITLGTTKFKSYRTLRGDSLQKISTRYYGRPDFYLDVYLANQDQLRNPAEVPSGITLKIPVYE